MSLTGRHTPQRLPAVAASDLSIFVWVAIAPVPAQVPAQYLLSPAHRPRTLIDILYDTAARYPDAAAHRRRHGAAHLQRADRRHRGQRRLAGRPRHRPRRPDRHPDAVGQLRAVRGDPVDAGHRRGLRAGRCRRPRRTRRAGVRRGRRRRRHHRSGPDPRARLVARLAGRGAAGPRRRVDHLHVRIDRHTEGRRGHPPQRRRVRRRRSADVPAGQPDWARRPGAGRAVGGVRRVVRGDVAGLAARRLPGARPALAGAQRHGPRSVAGHPRHHRGLDRADAGGAVARRGAGGGAAADLRRRGLPAGAGRAAGRRRPRGVEHLRPDRGDRGRVRGQARRLPDRSASGCRCRAGTWPSSTTTASRWATARSANW